MSYDYGSEFIFSSIFGSKKCRLQKIARATGSKWQTAVRKCALQVVAQCDTEPCGVEGFRLYGGKPTERMPFRGVRRTSYSCKHHARCKVEQVSLLSGRESLPTRKMLELEVDKIEFSNRI